MYKTRPNIELWRTALGEWRRRVNMTYKEIADKALLSEKTVSRVFTGEAKSPSVDIVGRIITAMGASWRDIFGESAAVITTVNTDELQAEIDRLKSQLKETESELSVTKIKLEYEQKINELHSFYKKEKEQ
jgi:transcriptional regulator with XRE-family HTH domain